MILFRTVNKKMGRVKREFRVSFRDRPCVDVALNLTTHPNTWAVKSIVIR